MKTDTTLIWFSPDITILPVIQQHFRSYSWTSSVESLTYNYPNIEGDPLILFDLQGYDKPGEIIQQIHTSLPYIPIMLIVHNTEMPEFSLIDNLLQQGATDFFMGPVDSALLKHRIQMIKKSNLTRREAFHNLATPTDEFELAFMAFYDELTGLANRKLFFARLDEHLKQPLEDDEIIGLLYIDLDGFKQINDRFTHKAGDWLLQQVATRLRHGVKRTDTVARVGGDEFCIILADSLSESAIASVAQRIIYQLSSPYRYEDKQMNISASVGISLYPGHALNSHKLLNRADLAMYVAKQQGPGQYRFYHPSYEETGTHSIG